MKAAWLRFIGLFPHKLPIGVTEFDQFCSNIFAAYEIPDLSSYKQAVASMIMHIPPTKTRKSLAFFAASIRKGQANEVAYGVIKQIQQEQKKAVEALLKTDADGKSVSDDSIPPASG